MRKLLLGFCGAYLLFAVGLNAFMLPVRAESGTALSAAAMTLGFAAGLAVVVIGVVLARYIRKMAAK